MGTFKQNLSKSLLPSDGVLQQDTHPTPLEKIARISLVLHGQMGRAPAREEGEMLWSGVRCSGAGRNALEQGEVLWSAVRCSGGATSI